MQAQSSPHPVSTAFWTFVIPMTSTRAMRIGLVLLGLFMLGVVMLFMSGFALPWLGTTALVGMRHFLVMAGVPVGAVLLSEIPIRDGITHRTLLYPLLGPVPRATLAVVRIVTTGAILALGLCIALILVRLALQDGFAFLPRELLSIVLGSFAYVALFGLIHLLSRRGLIIGIVVFFMFDAPLGKVPFSVRNLSPSYHVGVVANQQESLQLPISFGQPDASAVVSALVLLAMAIVFVTATAAAFTRKNLVDLS